MTTPRIPTGLKPVAQGYNIGAAEGVVLVDVGGGLPRITREWDGGYQAFHVSLVLPSDQFWVWTLFYQRIARNGSVPFDMPLDTGLGMADHTCRMVPGSYSAARAGGQVWSVTFDVLAQSAAYDLTDAAVKAILDPWEPGGYTSLPTPRLPSLFKPVVQGYSAGSPDGVAASDIPGGVPSVAAQWDRGIQAFSVGMVMTAAKLQAWTAFYHQEIRNGSLQFVMRIDSGFGLEDHTCVMVPGSQAATPLSGKLVWSVSFTVLAQASVYAIATSDVQQLLDLWEAVGAEADDLLARLAQFANFDTLALQL